MPEVRIVSSSGRVKRRFNSTLHPDDVVGARQTLEHWSNKLGLKNATLEIHDKRCHCRRKFDARN